MYFENTLKRFELQDANSTKTPLPAGIHMEKSEEPVAFNTKTYYQQIIRTLIYATIGTRPDIAFVAMRFSQFNNNPTGEHIKYAKYVLQYLGEEGQCLAYTSPSGYNFNIDMNYMSI